MDIEIKRKLLMKPTENKWEDRAVLNPTTIKDKEGVTHIFYRAVADNWVSSIGHAKIINGELQRFNKPIMRPTKSYEKKGIEDPRVTKIGNTYYMLYTAFDGKDARIAYATSKNLTTWKKHGIISPNISTKEARKLVKIKKYRDKWKNQEIYGSKICLWDKDAVLFPEKIKGEFIMLHRFLPDIQIVKFKNFSQLKKDNFWRNYISNLSEGEDKVSLFRRYDWEGEHIGAGAVPVKTKDGWLLIYHGVELIEQDTITGTLSKIIYKIKGTLKKLRNDRLPLIYHAGAALLDLKNPEIEISRLEGPLFSPKYNWEKEGDIGNVVFPEGTIIEGDRLKIYYGCADTRIAVAELSLKQLLKKLKQS